MGLFGKAGLILAGAAIGAVVTIAISLGVHHDWNQNDKKLAECSQALHAAQARDQIWTYPPIGYDWNGNPAIVLNSKYRYTSLLTQQDILGIVQATECVASKGQLWNRPIEVIWEDHSPSAHYTGFSIEMKK